MHKEAIHPSWAHITTTLRGWWLPGDARGFRSRDHRIHSSGNYLEPPPIVEHELLRIWAEARSAREFPLAVEERRIVVDACVETCRRYDVRLITAACAPTHLHVLAEVDGDALSFLGRVKQLASHRLARRSGRVWARGGGVHRPRSESHLQAALDYIHDHRNEGASVFVNVPLIDALRRRGNAIRFFVEDSSEAASSRTAPYDHRPIGPSKRP